MVSGHFYAGFSSVVLITGCLGGIAYYQLDDVVERTDTRSRIENNTRSIISINGLADRIVAQSLNYRMSGSPSSLSEMETTRLAIASISDEVAQNTISNDRKSTYKKIGDLAASLREDISNLEKSTTSANETKQKLFRDGDQLTKTAGILVTEVRSKGDDAQISSAQTLEAALLLVRVANWRYLATMEPKGPATFEGNVQKAKSAVRTLRDLDPNRQFASTIKAAEDALYAYDTAFTAAVQALNESRVAFDEGVKPKTAAIIDAGARARSSAEARMTEIMTTTEASVRLAEKVQTGLIAAALALGGILAFLIARNIIRPITGMTGAMRSLAEGDTQVVVPSQNAVDELGAMAKAVEVFRVNAIARVDLETAQAAVTLTQQTGPGRAQVFRAS